LQAFFSNQQILSMQRVYYATPNYKEVFCKGSANSI
jgi:hypothetical protein